MKIPTELYNDSLATLTDLYQLTMAYSYWKNNIHEKNAAFHLFFRNNPFEGDFAIVAGTECIANILENFHFRQDDLEYLATLRGADAQPLFEPNFLRYLAQLKLTCQVDAISEGTVVFANEPLVRVVGPIIQCQLLETILLNVINFQTLIATKAARVCLAAGEDRVVEFGLRRAQGMDGGLAASRAAYIGGCAATSNVLAGKLFDIPVIGTHAHSWVMSFPNETDAFEAYAFAMPNNCVFLVDTYNTLNGVKAAIAEGLNLRKRGHEMIGIRLDSGDLCTLSIHARQLLDAAGFTSTAIIASNDLDEHKILDLKDRGAKINSWGVGTSLVTAADQPALGGVYKLGAIEGDHGWEPKIKVSNDIVKITNPGILCVNRYSDNNGKYIGDIISNTDGSDTMVLWDGQQIALKGHVESLLVPLFTRGKVIGSQLSLAEVRNKARTQLHNFVPDVSNLRHPPNKWRLEYHVGVELQLHNRKMKLIDEQETT